MSGLAVCFVCDSKLNSGTQRYGSTLKCPAGPSRHVNRRAERIEEFVTTVVLARSRRPDAINLVQSRAEGIDLRALTEKAGRLRKNLTEYAQDAGAGRLKRTEYFELRDTAHARLSEIDAQLVAAGRTDVVAQFSDVTRYPAEVWQRCFLPTKRAVIDAQSGKPSGCSKPEVQREEPRGAPAMRLVVGTLVTAVTLFCALLILSVAPLGIAAYEPGPQPFMPLRTRSSLWWPGI